MFRLAAPVDLKAGDAIVGDSGAVVSGARPLTSFQRTSAGLWFAPGQTDNATLAGTCSADRPACQQANDVFLDDQPLRRVSRLADLVPGCSYSDPTVGRIYIADNPAGHRVEVAVTGIAFRALAPGGTIRGLVIEKFAGHGMNGNDWLVEDNEVRLNHGIGIASSSGVLRHNFVHDNGELGIGSTGTTRSNLLVENNEVSHNNYAGYSADWQAGGAKWVASSHVTVSGNYFHDNGGPGIWFDWDNRYIVVENNRIEDNAREGVLIEASFDAVVRNNQVRRNGFRDKLFWVLGAGILNANSTRVDVYGNTVENNLNGIGATERGGRGTGPYGLRETRDFTVHDNTVRMPTGFSGFVVTTGDKSYYESKGNRFWNNTYFVGCQKPFIWSAPATVSGFDVFSFDQWSSFGSDTTSSFTSSCGAATPTNPPPVVPAPPAVGAPGNSSPGLANGGFETGLTGWAPIGSKESLSVGAIGPHSGSQYAEVTATGTSTEGIRIPGSVPNRAPVTPGSRFTLSVWARGQGKVRLRVMEYTSTGISLGAGTYGTPISLGTSWQQLTLPATMSARAASFTVWVETAWPQVITYDVDDVAIL